MRDEFGLIETGIQDMNRYVMEFEHRDANNTDRRYLAVPWNCIITRCGFVVHHTVDSSALKATWGVDRFNTSMILFFDSDSSNEEELTILAAEPPGTTRWGITKSNNVYVAGQVLMSETRNPVSTTTGRRATTFIELQRTA